MKCPYIIILLLFLVNCTRDYSDQYTYNLPIGTTDGLNVDSLGNVGIREKHIRNAAARIANGKYGEIHAMLIYRQSKLAFEDYFEGHVYQWDAPGHKGEVVRWNRDIPHCIHSDTKSITSLCIGIAIEKGFIDNVDQSIFDYLPGFEAYKKDGKEKITIEHLLTMTSGLEWEEWKISLGSIENDQIGIWFYEDGPVHYVLRKPLIESPGSHFNYSGGDIQLLAQILHNATGLNLEEFSAKYLFKPMGITSNDWWLIFASGEIQAAGGLKLLPRDMIKVGAMLLNKGVWNGTRIISEEWIEKCLVPYRENKSIRVPGEDLGKLGYGYTWWTKSIDHGQESVQMYTAIGWGGQKISIMPELEIVVVFTGANYTSNVHNFEIMEKFILPAIMDADSS